MVPAISAGMPSPAARRRRDCAGYSRTVGFYYLAGHGLPQPLIDRTYEASARFHAQPMARKLALKVNEHNIGYLPISDVASPQAAVQGSKPSRNEAYFLRRERTPDDPAGCPRTTPSMVL